MRRLIAVGVLGLLSVGCGDNPLPTAPPPIPTPAPVTRAAISINVAPNPVVASNNSDRNFPYSMQYTLEITETAGLAVNINRIVQGFASGNDAAIVWTPDLLVAGVGTNHIPPKGTYRVVLGSNYSTDTGNRAATVRVTVEAIDANNNTVTATQTFNVV
jgi:hypothetical protein